ncbi:sulfite exporter TauE/SafE family protein [Massilia cavernae]|uniref:Sulfite exporter TauE/SafE family protein n=1 Tax=Massilia cavernae TaxID=2320864 RepID=A0A418XR02_9BURK|nr:sulfite exporter TauE/SafE family protein [Massilia cavernae]RJG14954.1 sulfite exporter TauE/SafE family protein [Massilia cavernae]
MSGISLFPVFLVGLFGSVHCAGMCGGIVSAFSITARPFPVAVVTQGAGTRVASYNAGRIASYMLAGALAGGLAGGARVLGGVQQLQAGGYLLANLMLVALGLYLMDAWRGLAHVEALGNGLWNRIRPLAQRLQPLDGAGKMLGLGALWGWLPCGMVYSALVTAMFSGSALSGAAVMLAFGLGTLPMLMAIGLAGARLRAMMQRRAVRIGAGVVVLGFGLLGVARAMGGVHGGWLDLLCLPGATA